MQRSTALRLLSSHSTSAPHGCEILAAGLEPGAGSASRSRIEKSASMREMRSSCLFKLFLLEKSGQRLLDASQCCQHVCFRSRCACALQVRAARDPNSAQQMEPKSFQVGKASVCNVHGKTAAKKSFEWRLWQRMIKSRTSAGSIFLTSASAKCVYLAFKPHTHIPLQHGCPSTDAQGYCGRC